MEKYEAELVRRRMLDEEPDEYFLKIYSNDRNTYRLLGQFIRSHESAVNFLCDRFGLEGGEADKYLLRLRNKKWKEIFEKASWLGSKE